VLPKEQLIYVGDTQHMPYGDKSAEHIQAYTKRMVDFFLNQQVKLIIIACNTASALAASYVRSLYWQQVEIIGVIRPVIKTLLEKQVTQVGIIGTKATIESNIYQKILSETPNNITLHQMATPLLAPMIENGNTEDEIAQAILHQYLSNSNFESCEALVLACTHYPIIKKQIAACFHRPIELIDNAQPMATTVQHFLQSKNLLAETRIAENAFYVTEFTPGFERTAQLFYGANIQIQELLLKETN
jgi:glutamate racemase